MAKLKDVAQGFSSRVKLSDLYRQQPPPVVWTLAASDSGGGAGLNADLCSCHDWGVHPCTLVTAVTAQNTTGIAAVQWLDVAVLQAQFDALFAEFPPQVIKLSVLGDQVVLDWLCESLQSFAHKPWIIFDPVLSASAGTDFVTADTQQQMVNQLLAQVDIITPNIPELERLTGHVVRSHADVEAAAQQLLDQGVGAVWVKGGHSEHLADAAAATELADYFVSRSGRGLHQAAQRFWLCNDKLPHGAHGTGCRLAAALAALLAHGHALEDAVVLARAYLAAALSSAYAPQAGSARLMPAVDHFRLAHLPRVHTARASLSGAAPGFAACPQLGLYPVVDSVEWLHKLLPLGVRTIQLRLKNNSEAENARQIREAVALQQQFAARLFINDHWRLAIEHGAYGVHLGQEDLYRADLQAIAKAGLFLGVSTHSWWEIARAHALAPSYIAIGPVYATQTKAMVFEPQGEHQLRIWQQLLQASYPLVAIGGIDEPRARQLHAQGVDNIALVSAITQADDYRQATQRLLALIGSGDAVDGEK